MFEQKSIFVVGGEDVHPFFNSECLHLIYISIIAQGGLFLSWSKKQKRCFHRIMSGIYKHKLERLRFLTLTSPENMSKDIQECFRVLKEKKTSVYLSKIVISKSRFAITNPKPIPIPINTPFTAVTIIEEKYPKLIPIASKPCINRKITSIIKVIITARSIKDNIALITSFFFSISQPLMNYFIINFFLLKVVKIVFINF